MKSTCAIVSTNLNSSATCSVNGYVISVTGALNGMPFNPTLNSTFTLTFNVSYNPLSTAPLGSLLISTYENQSSSLYAVDTNSASNLYTFTNGAINTITITPASFVAYQSSVSYVFSLITSEEIPPGSKLTVTIPPTIYV